MDIQLVFHSHVIRTHLFRLVFDVSQDLFDLFSSIQNRIFSRGTILFAIKLKDVRYRDIGRIALEQS